MTDLRKAAENLIKIVDDTPYGDFEMALSELRQALKQPEQEPVAWGLPNLQDPIRRKQALLRVDLKIPDGAQFPQFWVPLYTAPPKREWQRLTEDDKHFLLANAWNKEQAFDGFMDAIDKFLEEKNT